MRGRGGEADRTALGSELGAAVLDADQGVLTHAGAYRGPQAGIAVDPTLISSTLHICHIDVFLVCTRIWPCSHVSHLDESGGMVIGET